MSKDCLSRETRAIFPTLRSRSNFSGIIRANKKDFIFWQGNCTMNVLHPHLSKSFALRICSRDPMKNWTLGYFSRLLTSCNHNASLEDDHCVPFLKFKFLISTLRHMLYLPKPSNIYQEMEFVSYISRNKLKIYTSLWFKNRDFYFWWWGYMWILPKNTLSSSLVNIVFLHTFLL